MDLFMRVLMWFSFGGLVIFTIYYGVIAVEHIKEYIRFNSRNNLENLIVTLGIVIIHIVADITILYVLLKI